jgi:hypothetical protein
MPNKFSKKKNKVKKVKIMYGGLFCPNPSNKAYMMLGHGSTDSSIKDVPDNCVYITTTLCGNISYRSLSTDRFLSFFKKNRELVKDPCSYSNFEVINRFVSENSESDYYIGNTKTNDTSDTSYSVDNPMNSDFLNMHVSRETCRTSAKCPKSYLFRYKDAYYEPCSYWYFKDGKSYNGPNIRHEHDRVDFQRSGLIDSDDVSDSYYWSIKKIERPWKYPMVTIQDIEYIYEYSVYPKTRDILAKIREIFTRLRLKRDIYLEINDPRHPSYIDIYSDSIYDEYIISAHDFINIIIRKHFSITQSELFKLFPGVHYNTICRQFSEGPSYLKKIQRQISVDNKDNLANLYDEEHVEEIRTYFTAEQHDAVAAAIHKARENAARKARENAATASDSATTDSGTTDSGTTDSGTTDSTTTDSATTDSATTDSTTTDSATTDSAATDSEPITEKRVGGKKRKNKTRKRKNKTRKRKNKTRKN